jgi:putative hydrolase of the HAD superfamily
LITAVVCDFGGVLTSPLMDAFLAFQEESGIPLEALYGALGVLAERTGAHPLYELEKGRITEHEFLEAIAAELTAALGRKIDMHGFGEAYFAGLRPNQPMIELMRALRAERYRMALCTNNVREWEPRWRAMLPVDEIFELVVDSAYVGVRKPEPEIYQITLDRLGVPAGQALFIDDVDVNCDGARAAGMRAVQFLDTEQATGDIRAALAAG